MNKNLIHRKQLLNKKMLIKFLIISTILLTGCASITTPQVTKIGGTGRFAQMSKNGHLFIQMDMESPIACQAEMGTIKPEDIGNFDVLCNTVSSSENLPYYFTTLQIITNTQHAVIRAITMEACILVRNESLNLPKASAYKFSECKKL